MSKVSFKKRYLSEAETAQTITNEINKASDFASQNNKKENAPTPGVTQNAAVTVAAPEQSLIKSNEALGDMGVRATPNDASKVDSVLKNEAHNSQRENSQTPFNQSVSLGESIYFNEAHIINNIDIDARIPGKFDNALTKKLRGVGMNTGVKKIDVSTSQDASKSGQKDINKGTLSSFTLGRHDASRQAKDGLKTGMNTPKKDDINKATVITAGAFLKIGKLVEEYTSADVEKSGGIPGNRDQSQKFQGVQPGYHQGASARQTANMNEIVDDKMAKAAGNRKMTAPEVDTDYAAEKTAGIESSQYKEKRNIDAQNAQTSAQREQRLSGGEE